MSAEGDSSSSPGAIIGVIVAVTLFALGIGYLLFQRGLKKKQEKAREVKVTHLATRHVGEEDFHLDEVDEKISKDAKEKSKGKGMINGKTKKEIDKGMKKSSADGITGDTKSGPQNSENDKEALLEVNKEDINDSEFDKIAESVAVATRTKKRRQANTTNKLKTSFTRKRRNNPIARTANKLKASLTNAAPKIISMEFDESSDDESSSSSEEEEEEGSSSSSSDSDSSSSSKGSESSSQIKARKRREKRIAADKKKSTNTKGKKPSKPRRSNTNTKQRQRPSRPSRSNNIV